MENNKLQKFRTLIFVLLLLPCLILFSACSSNGLSAYEIAVKHGFDGTEKEWLESLKGENGYDGTNAPTLNYYEIYKSAKENNEFAGTYIDFLKTVLNSENVDCSTTINKAISSVVSIKAYTSASTSQNASGVIYKLNSNGDAIIITNYHVVYTSNTSPGHIAKTIKVSLFGDLSNYTAEATYIGGSREYDLAVLKITNCSFLNEAGATAITINPNAPKIGIKVFAVGNAKGYGLSATTGILSKNNDNVKMEVAGQYSYYRLIRHTSMTAGGNSGGGLFNSQGELIGITNGGDRSDTFINYAIPASDVLALTENILANCDGNENIKPLKVEHGLSFVSLESSLKFNHETGETIITDNVTVATNESTIAELQDIVSGDKITKIKIEKTSQSPTNPEVIERTISRQFEIEELLLYVYSNDKLTITFSRNGSSISKTILLTTSNFTTID